jgi:predicted ATPase
MTHLKSIGIENFKVFQNNMIFKFKPITILTGQNSSGKTSLTHAIRLIQANKENVFASSELNLKFNNEAAVLRSFQNIVSKSSNNNEVKISLPFEWNSFYEKFIITLKFKPDENSKLNEGLLCEAYIMDSNDICIYRYSRTTLPKGKDHVENTIDGIFNDNTKTDWYINLEYIVKNVLNNIKITKQALETYSILLNRNGINEGEEISILQNLQKDEKYQSSNAMYNNYIEGIKNIKNYINILYYSFSDEGKVVVDAQYGNGGMFQIMNGEDYGYQDPSSNTFYFLSKLLNETGLLYNYDSREIHEAIKGEKFFKVIQEIEISNLVVNKNDDLFKPSMGDFSEHIAKSRNEIPDRIKNIADQIYVSFGIKIEPEKITENGNYEIVKKTIDGLKDKIKLISNNLNFHFVPSVRAINSSAYSRDTKTYLESVVFDVLNEAQSKERLDYLTFWLQYFGICSNVQLIPLSDSGLFEILLVDEDGSKSKLNEVGYGYSQLLPIILKLCLPPKDLTQFIIEEPETNLHPSLQSKLAIFFAEVQKKYRYQLIIETHSEYFIRKLQFLIATKKYSKDDLALYYFYHPKNIPIGEQQIKEITIGENGLLQDRFGPGFIDEADNIAMDLFHLTKGQNN